VSAKDTQRQRSARASPRCAMHADGMLPSRPAGTGAATRRGYVAVILFAADDGPGGMMLSMTGTLDYTSADMLALAVQQAYDSGAALVAADVTGVGCSDFSGLAVLDRAHRTARSFIVHNPDIWLSRTFAVAALATLLVISHAPDQKLQ
jgi:ABC-type transporter Mla MlaB component